MTHKNLTEIVDKSLQDLTNSNTLLRSKNFICAGDFRQIPSITSYN